MSNYKTLHGQKVQAVSSDPSNPITGQVWYNTSTNKLKYKAPQSAGSWSTGGNLNSGRTSGAAFGLQDASIYTGGRFAPGPGRTNITESYNGSSWTEVGDMPENLNHLAGAGIQSAGLVFGGEPETANAKTWNGSAWTEVGNLNTARHGLMGAGLQSSALAFGGEGGPSNTTIGNTESWNGSAWSEVADLNTARESGGNAGESNSSALLFGGGAAPSVPSGKTETESWNGSSWTEVGDLNLTAVYQSGCGTATEALSMGRFHPSPSNWSTTEEYNGSSWSEVADMSSGRYFTLSGSGTQSAGMLTGGQSGPGVPNMTATEEFTKPGGVETISTT